MNFSQQTCPHWDEKLLVLRPKLIDGFSHALTGLVNGLLFEQDLYVNGSSFKHFLQQKESIDFFNRLMT